jgi:Transposase DDE domain
MDLNEDLLPHRQAYQKAMNKRKVWVEPLFAEAKDWHGLRRFRLRRLWRVNCEAVVIATGQNLKRLLQKRGWGRRPFPAATVAAVPHPNWKEDEHQRDTALKRKENRARHCIHDLLEHESEATGDRD